MSTRCQIGIYEKDEDVSTDAGIIENASVFLYRHSDGYPGSTKKDDIGVVPDILPFIKEFKAIRGHDVEYMNACLMAYLKQWHCGEKMSDTCDSNHMVLSVNDIHISSLSHGVNTVLHCDIEYFYAITPSKLIVYKVNGWGKSYKFRKVKSFVLTSKKKAVA